VITNPLHIGFYTRTNQLLIEVAVRDQEALVAGWEDAAAAAALDKNPRRADYLEHLARRARGAS
jgi:hypothetical protein